MGSELARVDVAELEDLPLGASDRRMSEGARRRMLEGINSNTARAYRRWWAHYLRWCLGEGRTPVPATPETLAEWVNALCDEDLAPATIRQAMAVVRVAHREAGHRDEPDTRAALHVLRAHQRARANSGRGGQREAPPVTIPALRSMIEACDLSTPAGLRDRAAMVLGLALMGRRSELCALDIGDVAETAEGLEVTIRMSKTDQDARGETIAVPAGSHPLTNPVAAWREWVACLESHGITSGRLLRSVDRHGNIGESLSGNAVNEILRRLAARAELPNADRYTAHSLRAGGATVAYAAGVPVSVIARHGRWKPDSPVVLRYIRAVDRWRDNAMKDVGL